MKKVLPLIIAVCFMFFFLTGCQQQKEAEKVTVNIAGLQGPTSIGMIKMIEDTPSLGQDVSSNYQIAQNPDIMVAKIIAGEVDFAIIPINLAAKIYNKGVDYRLAAMSTWGVLYVVGSEAGIKEWQDFEGKTVYSIGKGTSPDIIFRYLMAKNGLDPDKDVQMNYSLGQIELAEAVIAEKVKLALLPEPFVTMMLTKNSNIALVMDIQEEWNKVNEGKVPFAQSGMVVRGEFAQKYPAIVAQVLEEYKKSIDWVNANPKEAGILTEKHNIGIKADIAEVAIPRCNQRFEDAQTSKEAVEAYLRVLYDFSPSDIGGKLPDEKFYYKK
jgi:NitT/TauT family transport system substrate-binding protein